MITIAICNLKGGVAKTTTAVNLAAILAHDRGRRVLVIDADSQANATSFLGGDKTLPGMAAMLRGEQSDEKPIALQLTNVEGVSLVAADASLMALDLTRAGDGRADVQCLRKLRGILEQRERIATAARALARNDTSSGAAAPPSPQGEGRWEDLARVIWGEPFEYCLIDCPPAFNAASSAALIAADEVLIPVKLDAFAMEGMANLMEQIQNMRRINPRLRLLGILPVMWYKSDTVIHAESALRNAGLLVLPRIRRSDRVDDMTYAQKPLIACSPKCGPCRDYRVLAAVIDNARHSERSEESPGRPGERSLDYARDDRRGARDDRETDCHTSAAALVRNDRGEANGNG